MLASVKEEFADRVYFISLTIEDKDDQAAVRTWLESNDASGLNAGKWSETVAKRLHAMAGVELGGVPTSILIDAEGEVVGGHFGVPSREEIAESADQIAP